MDAVFLRGMLDRGRKACALLSSWQFAECKSYAYGLPGVLFKLDLVGIADEPVTLAPNLDDALANSNVKLLQRLPAMLSIHENLGSHPLAGGIKSSDDDF